MAAVRHLWTPPDGMPQNVINKWSRFYSYAMDTYGITPAQYRWLYQLQKGRCWICRTAKGVNPDDPAGRGSRRLGIDHNHITGQVRGLLCSGGDKTCNRIIGWLPARSLRRAADYLDGTATPGLMIQMMDTDGGLEVAGAAIWKVAGDAQ